MTDHDDAVDKLASTITRTLSESADAEIAANAVRVGAKDLSIEELEQYEAAAIDAREAIKILSKIGGPITGVAANEAVHSSPVFNPAHALAWDMREPFKDRSKDSSDS